MKSIYIYFPISTVQYEERYMLGLEFDWTQSLQDAIDADSAFTAKTTQYSEVTATYEGMLNGDIKIKTDSRDTIYAPLVTSKLNFNLVSHNFPSWIMEATQYYTSVRCVLCARIKNEWSEAWRGYLWGNTLNSTVVDDWIKTSIYALDELSMAKYIKVGNTIGEYGKSRRLWSYFAYYKSFNDSNFGWIYTLMGSNSTDQIYWDDNLCLKDSNGNPLPDLLGTLWLDSYMYVNYDNEDEMQKWSDLFTDVCDLLGVTFCVGGYSWPKDAYLITTMNPQERNVNYTRFTHDNEYYTGVTTSTTSNFMTITPSEKVDASFNITLQPQKWKGAKFTSEAKRYEVHEYLDDDNLEYYNEDKYCLERWGTSGKSTNTIAQYCIVKPMYHKLYYMKPTSKENNYISATTQNINLNYTPGGQDMRFENLAYLIHYNYISADTQAQNYDYPKTADTLDYLITKRGAAIVKMGTFERRDVEEDSDLENYLIMMNHKWYQAYHFPLFHSDIAINDGDALTGNDFAYVKFMPWKNHQIRHTNEDYYLQIDYSMLAIDENKGVIDFPTSASPYHRTYIGNTQIDAWPCTETNFDYDDDNSGWDCVVGSYYDNEPIQGFPPMIQLRATIGDRYLDSRGNWMPLSQQGHYPAGYNMRNFPDSYDTCVYAISAMTDSFGYKFTAPYNTLHPRNDGGKKRFLLNVGGYGGAGAPIDGNVEIEFWGPAVCYDWGKNAHSYRNNIYYLLKDIEFKFTDMAEIEGKDMVLETTDIYDTLSKTKEIRKKEFNLCSPKYSGLFYNCFKYSDGKGIYNARKYYKQNNLLSSEPAEQIVLRNYTEYDWPSPMTIDLKMRYHAEDNYYHNQLIISGLTEAPNEIFVVREKTFNITRNIVDFKADRVLLYEDDKKTSEGEGDKIQINDYEDTGVDGDQINRDDTVIDETDRIE